MCWRADVPAGKEGWCWLAFAPSSFISLVTVVVGRKNASTSFLIPHAGPRMHKRLQWFVVQLTSSGTRGLLWLQRGSRGTGRDEAWVSAACLSVAPRSLGSSQEHPTAAPQRCPGNGGAGLGCRMQPGASLGFKERGTGSCLPKTAEEQKTALHVPSLECLEPASHCSHRSFHV